ncbi:PleD family two-component system response regulator [uncultured Phenylobacterium sp.]|uniref:response regulator n=1 Tax=uncultured Phenylobacterium sp. TaxID=349273 RepID=UPI0025DE698B|nr:response regulator [uncultured Phenylobacterium sp.]
MAAAAPEAAETAPPEAAARPTGNRLDLKKAKVLIVDDSQQALEILAQALLGFGVRNPHQARSCEEVAKVLERESFDLIILDGEMPTKDGFDLTTHVRASPGSPNYTAPIMILSSFTPRHKITRARDTGANLVLTKPIIPAILLERMEWLARSPRLFVTSPGYCGPDRRFKKVPLPEGIAERRADDLRLIAQPERAMSQNEIDSLFG